MDSKVCVVWKTEKIIDNFYNNYRECKPCNILGSTRRYYENKDKLSNQQININYFMKKIEMSYLQSLI